MADEYLIPYNIPNIEALQYKLGRVIGYLRNPFSVVGSTLVCFRQCGSEDPTGPFLG